MRRPILLFLACFPILSATINAETVTVDTIDGASVVGRPGYSGFMFRVDTASSLFRSWLVVNDKSCPAALSGSGIIIRGSRGKSVLTPTGTISASEPIAAYEVRYVLFDVFGEHMRTIFGTRVTDVPADTPSALKNIGAWQGTSNEGVQMLTVVSFIAKVRTASGKVWNYDEKAIAGELGKVIPGVDEGVLETTERAWP